MGVPSTGVESELTGVVVLLADINGCVGVWVGGTCIGKGGRVCKIAIKGQNREAMGKNS